MEIKRVANKFTLSLSTISLYSAAKTLSKPLKECMSVYSQVNINKEFHKHLTVARISAKTKEELTAQDRSYSLGEFFQFCFFSAGSCGFNWFGNSPGRQPIYSLLTLDVMQVVRYEHNLRRWLWNMFAVRIFTAINQENLFFLSYNVQKAS